MTLDLASSGWKQQTIGGFSAHVGPFWTRRGEQGHEIGFVVEERHLNGNGIVHGGMLMTFIDQSIGMRVYHAIDRVPCATIQLDTHFVEAGRLGDFIEARTEIVRQTSSIVFTRGSLVVRREDGGERLLISAEGIWKVLRPRAPAPKPDWE